MTGKRADPPREPGEYGLVHVDDEATWVAVTPSGHHGSLTDHDVVEHEDGTITVSPSILLSDDTGELWHGYLERGVWREV